MPHSLSPSPKSTPKNGGNGIYKFTNCRVLRGEELVEEDVWVNSITGKIIKSQSAFYDDLVLPNEIVDLGGRILSPGLIECQLNGAFGFNFSALEEPATYAKQVKQLNKKLVRTGVTSYVPTITSQRSEVYQAALPFLGPSGYYQVAEDGAESLGAHVEGPFLNPTKNGIHNVDVLRQAQSFDDLADCYGLSNLTPDAETGRPLPIKMITAAPELGEMTALIPELTRRGIVFSMGHSDATYEEASAAVAAGASMITHLFNAMRPLHHRNPGIFGVLGTCAVESTSAENRPKRPYFGVIADGEHLHPTTVKIAWGAHPAGFVLVSDAMHMVGLPDGAYRWTNGDCVNHIVKKGSRLVLDGTDKIAGSSITLMECVNNFLNWSGASIPQALRTVTATPAAMLGLGGRKGCLKTGADADMVVLSERRTGGGLELVVDEVWKFGTKVCG